MKKIVIVLMLCFVAVATFAQTKQTLAILPFTGGSGGDGETLAELFSFDQTINSAFTPIPRTSINAAIQKEQGFQMSSGMTDPETISRIGKQLGARYIVAGSITRLGGQQLLVIAIMQIENLQQIAGEYLAYQNISEVRGKLPEMAKNIVAASRNDTSRFQRLAVLPFQMPSGDREADALAQILAIEIIKTGTYAVFPRTKTLEQVQSEYNTQTSGITDDYSIAAIGRGDNPLLALSGAARRLGQDRMFNAAVINVESGAQIKGDSVDYQVIEDGIEAMRKLAGLLTSSVTIKSSDYKVANIQELLRAVDGINGQGTGNYTITLTADITVGSNDKDIRFSTNAQKTITIRGDTAVRSLTSQRQPNQDEGIVLIVQSGITIVLGGNLRISSKGYGVSIRDGGSLRMENGTTIANCGTGVYVVGGTFIMNGGIINGNGMGINLSIHNGGTFTMNGGSINGNRGSGVSLGSGNFIMNNGTISGNRGAGVLVYSNGNFTMIDGTIRDNTRTVDYDFDGGGGVYVLGTFTMNGGTISGNTSRTGGGVYVTEGGSFIKTGGTITADNKATVQNGGNIAYANSGKKKRNSAAGPSVNMDSSKDGKAGGWE